MYWNNRVVDYGEKLRIEEVFYRNDGYPNMHTQNGIGIDGGNIEELEMTFVRFKKAIEKDILHTDDICNPPYQRFYAFKESVKNLINYVKDWIENLFNREVF